MSLGIPLIVFCVFLSSYLFFSLLTVSGKRPLSNGLLMAYLAIFTIQFLGHLFSYTVYGYARYSQYNSALALSSPALLYLHGTYLVPPKMKFKNKDLFHFILPLFVLIVALNKIVLNDYHRLIVYLSVLIYGIASFGLLNTFRKRKDFETTQQDIAIFKWLKWLYVIFNSIFFLDLILFLAFDNLGQLRGYLEILILSTITGFMSFMVFHFRSAYYSIHVFGNKTAPRYIEDLYIRELDFDSKNGTILTLKEHMENNQPFLNPELKLEDLSEELNMQKRVLSELINKQFGLNFISFINFYRIKMAIDLFKDPMKQNLTISEIMYTTGFNSKSVFNTTFKKMMGMTPSEYRAKIVKSS